MAQCRLPVAGSDRMRSESRPERIPPDNRSRERFNRLALSLGVGLCVLALLLNAGHRNGLLQRVVDALSYDAGLDEPQEAEPFRSVRSPPEAAREETGASTPPPSSLAGRQAGDHSVLATLAGTCRHWTSRNSQGQFTANARLACDEMRTYATRHGMTVPEVNAPSEGRSAQSGTTARSPQPHVPVNSCEHRGYGSVAYRQCRAAEQQRLAQLCASLRNEADRARGDRRRTLMTHARAVCHEARRYRIVN